MHARDSTAGGARGRRAPRSSRSGLMLPVSGSRVDEPRRRAGVADGVDRRGERQRRDRHDVTGPDAPRDEGQVQRGRAGGQADGVLHDRRGPRSRARTASRSGPAGATHPERSARSTYSCSSFPDVGWREQHVETSRAPSCLPSARIDGPHAADVSPAPASRHLLGPGPRAMPRAALDEQPAHVLRLAVRREPGRVGRRERRDVHVRDQRVVGPPVHLARAEQLLVQLLARPQPGVDDRRWACRRGRSAAGPSRRSTPAHPCRAPGRCRRRRWRRPG